MRLVSTAELTKLQSEQSDAMQDLCHIHHISHSSGTYGTKIAENRTSVTGVACGIDFTDGSVRQGNQVLVVDYDAILRLPASQTILLSDDIELIEKGEYLISGTFKPASQPVVTSTVQHIQLKRVVS